MIQKRPYIWYTALRNEKVPRKMLRNNDCSLHTAEVDWAQSCPDKTHSNNRNLYCNKFCNVHFRM